MKKVFLFATLIIGVMLTAFAQQPQIPVTQEKVLKKPLYTTAHPKRAIQNNSRASSVQFFIDYAGMDAEIALNSGTGVSHLGDPQDPQDDDPSVMLVNTSLPRDSVGYTTYAIQVYPRIIDYTTTTFPWNEYDLSKIQINVDTIQIEMGHVKNSTGAGTTNYIVVSVFDLDSVQSLSFDTGVAITSANGHRPYYRQVFALDSSLTGSPQPGFFSIGFLEVVPDTPIALPAGNTFAIQVQFWGPAEDEFYLLSGWRNDCGNTDCGADIPYVTYFYNANLDSFNTLAPQRFATGNVMTPFFPYPTQYLYNDCDQSGGPNAVCEQTRIEDILFFPTITVNIPNFYAEVKADKAFGCPGETIQVSGRGFGSSATPYTYNFTTSSGTFNAVDDSTQELTLGAANSTVILAVTDGASNTVYDTIVVASRGLTANINNGVDPLVIQCGTKGTLSVNLTGYTIGTETYQWSMQDSTRNQLTNLLPGNYAVTVTNSAGCTTSDNGSVAYPGGVTNTVSFTLSAPPYCKDQAITFTNTSTNTGSGWTGQWDVLGNQSVLIPALSTSYTYTSQGFFPVTLTMDSAGCKFVSQPTTVHVVVCAGVEDVAFENNISILPNPTSGNVNFSIEGIEKNVTIRISNILGSEVKTFNYTDVASTMNKNFDLSDLANGTYLVKISTAGKTAVKRLTISK